MCRRDPVRPPCGTCQELTSLSAAGCSASLCSKPPATNAVKMTQPTTPDAFMQRLAADAAALETVLEREIAGAVHIPRRLRDGMLHATLAGGKRLRPFLVMESAGLFGLARERAITAAAALECIHCYSLVHDDLPAMDNDRLRRGKPTVWAEFDEWTAILVGDGLLTFAFELLAREAAHPEAAVRNDLVACLARAAGPAGMVGGQCLDLESEKLNVPAAPDVAYVRHMQSLKTGALLRFACEAGAIIAQATPEARAALARFGDQIGFAFQIADDILDAAGKPEIVGKATGKDGALGKATLVELLGLEAARKQLRDVESAALDTLTPFGARADGLRAATRFIVAREH